MTIVMVAHALIGSVTVGSGTMALLLRKGSAAHKSAGRWFVGSMLLMGLVVAAGVWSAPGSISSLGILFTVFILYLVTSAWLAVRHSQARPARLDIAAPWVALSISVVNLMLGLDALRSPGAGENLPPVNAWFFFSALAFIAMLLDVNNLRVGGVRGRHRIVRHVWRMCCALFFATSTLFTGPGSIVFPESVRGNPVLMIPQLLVIVLALYWIYRLLFSRRQAMTEQTTDTLESQDSTNT